MHIKDDVKKRLAAFGYRATKTDDWLLDFIIQKVENQLKHECNVPVLPEGLHSLAIDMAMGEFLLSLKATDPESLAGLDLDAAVKQIQEGDTNITYALGEGSSTPEQRLDTLIAYLLRKGGSQLAAYRCMVW